MASSSGIINTVCKACHGGCGVLATMERGMITRLQGNPASLTRGTMCAKGLASVWEAYHPKRLKYPLLRKGGRGEGRWTRIGWEDALSLIADKVGDYRARYGPSSIAICQGTGRGYNRYTFRLARSIGTPNVGLPAHFCYGPKLAVFGMMVGGRLYGDYHGWGGVFPKTHISWGKQLEISNADGEMAVWFLKALKKAENLILVDPTATRLSGRADLWLQIRPGTDAALALGMLNVIIEEGLYDREFVRSWTHGFEDLRERVKEYTPQKVSDLTWIPAEKIARAARLLATEKPGCIQMGQSLEAGNNSVQTLRAIVSLMAVTGNIEKPGSMVNWMPPPTGCMEDFATEVPAPKELPVGAEQFKLLAVPPFAMCHMPTVFGRLAEGKGPVRCMHIQGSNPLVAYENTAVVKRGLMNLEFLSVVDLYMTPTAAYADLVLPAAHWLETDDIYDMHPRFMIGAVNKVVEPPGEAWPDNRIFNEIGKRLAPEFWFHDLEEMLDYQLRKAGLTWREFSRKGYLATEGEAQKYYKYQTDYWRKGGGFGTLTGKIELYSLCMEKLGYDPLPYYEEPSESPYSRPDLAREYPLILTTGGRNPLYFHSQYRQNPCLRKIQPYPLVQIHPKTARDHDIGDGDWVWIETPRGRIRQVASLFEGIDPRVIKVEASWWFPEDPPPDYGLWKSNANCLTDNRPPFDPAIGSTNLRALLCRVYKADEE